MQGKSDFFSDSIDRIRLFVYNGEYQEPQLRPNISKKSKNTGVKCLRDGELSAERKVERLAVGILHPASYGNRRMARSFFPAPYAVEERRIFLCNKTKSCFPVFGL
ncbi:MAG: hypothetical protein IJY42_05155 [Clostridia bacterium]|nr:hypothetical protein [Clostridia bacterium]